jgi:hypothetical protein
MKALAHARVCALGVLTIPAAAHATDMPPIEILFIPPILCALVATALLWFLFGRLPAGTLRSFLRMLVVVLLWSPVPDTFTGGFSILPSAVAWWFLGYGDAAHLLVVVMAVGICAVLGAGVIVVRSAWRLYTSPR